MNASQSKGLTTLTSNFSPKETMYRLQNESAAKESKVFVRIDHGAGGAEAGLDLPPTNLIIR